ncbi:hypothetical protein GCM10022245_52600 [Streptomyces mayteni]
MIPELLGLLKADTLYQVGIMLPELAMDENPVAGCISRSPTRPSSGLVGLVSAPPWSHWKLLQFSLRALSLDEIRNKALL